MPKPSSWEAEIREKVKEIMMEHGLREHTAEDLTEKLLRAAINGGELGQTNADEWLSRLDEQLVWLSTDEYARALIRGLSLAPSYAPIDFRTGGERDLVQIWADSTRGELGELGFVKFLKERFGVEAHVDKERGPLERYLARDITKIRKPGEAWADPKKRISIKDTKFQGVWLELPGAQVEHSDVYVLARSGLPISHMVSFFKHISIIREKLFPLARKLGELTEEAEKDLWDLLPEFEPPPVYITGFIERDKLDLRNPSIIKCRLVGRTEKTKRIEIYRGVGIFSEEAIRAHPEIVRLDPSRKYPIHIVPIKDRPDGSFLADGGSLTWGRENWLNLIRRL
jgi:hypothetical protein